MCTIQQERYEHHNAFYNTNDGITLSKNGVNAATNGASAAKDATESATNGASAAKDATELATNGASVAKDGTKSATNGAFEAKDETELATNGASAAKDVTESATNGTSAACETYTVPTEAMLTRHVAALSSSAAHDSMVAPVVITSSTTSRCFPSNRWTLETEKMERTLA